MRMMMIVKMGVEGSNRAAKNGQIGKVLMAAAEKLKPEAAYFAGVNGQRTAMYVFDMTDSAMLPTIAEPLFQELEATVEIFPVMNSDELKKGLAAAGIK